MSPEVIVVEALAGAADGMTLRNIKDATRLDHDKAYQSVTRLVRAGVVARVERDGWSARPSDKHGRFIYRLEDAA